MPQLLARIGRFSARHRLVVLALWLAAFAILSGVVASAGTSGGPSTTSIPSTQASKALDIVQQKFPGTQTDRKTLTLVLETHGGAKVTDPSTKAEVTRILTQAAAIPQVSSVSNPFDARKPFLSDGQNDCRVDTDLPGRDRGQPAAGVRRCRRPGREGADRCHGRGRR